MYVLLIGKEKDLGVIGSWGMLGFGLDVAKRQEALIKFCFSQLQLSLKLSEQITCMVGLQANYIFWQSISVQIGRSRSYFKI